MATEPKRRDSFASDHITSDVRLHAGLIAHEVQDLVV